MSETDPRKTVVAEIDGLLQERGQLRAKVSRLNEELARASETLGAIKAASVKALDVIPLRFFSCDINATSRPRPLAMSDGFVRRDAVLAAHDATMVLDLDTFTGAWEQPARLVLVGGADVFVDLGEGVTIDIFLAALAAGTSKGAANPKESK